MQQRSRYVPAGGYLRQGRLTLHHPGQGGLQGPRLPRRAAGSGQAPGDARAFGREAQGAGHRHKRRCAGRIRGVLRGLKKTGRGPVRNQLEAGSWKLEARNLSRVGLNPTRRVNVSLPEYRSGRGILFWFFDVSCGNAKEIFATSSSYLVGAAGSRPAFGRSLVPEPSRGTRKGASLAPLPESGSLIFNESRRDVEEPLTLKVSLNRMNLQKAPSNRRKLYFSSLRMTTGWPVDSITERQ